MKKKIVDRILLMCLIFMTGCAEQDSTATIKGAEVYENEEIKESSDGYAGEHLHGTSEKLEINEMPEPNEVSGIDRIPETDKISETKSILNIPVVDWKELTLETGKVNSIKNANHINMGYLCYDGNDYIYYVNSDESSIYRSYMDGSKSTKIFEAEGEKINYMQVHGDFLYFNTAEGICRMQRGSMKVEAVYTEPHGEFFVYEDNVYINTEEGLVRQSITGTEREIIWEYDGCYPVLWNMTGNMLIGTLVSNQSMEIYGKGYLIAFDLEGNERSLLGESCFNTIVSGEEIITYNGQNGSIQIWNTEIDSIQPLGHTSDLSVRPVANGEEVYFVELEYNESEQSMEAVLFSRSKEGVVKVHSVILEEGTWLGGLFCADDYVYILKQDSREGKNSFIWHYCCTSNGHAGVLN